jgi:hypothetical protein
MNPFHVISDAVDSFYEQSMMAPDFVLVGLREWTRLEQHFVLVGLREWTRLEQHFDPLGPESWTGLYVHTACGRIEVKCHPTYYSMIAPVVERMP